MGARLWHDLLGHFWREELLIEVESAPQILSRLRRAEQRPGLAAGMHSEICHRIGDIKPGNLASRPEPQLPITCIGQILSEKSNFFKGFTLCHDGRYLDGINGGQARQKRATQYAAVFRKRYCRFEAVLFLSEIDMV